MSDVREIMYGSYDGVEFPAFYIEGSPVRPMSESAYYSI